MTAPTLKHYQLEAINLITSSIGNRKRVLLSMAAGTGRTLTIVSALYAYYQRTGNYSEHKTLFIVNHATIAKQLNETILNVFGDNATIGTKLPEEKDKSFLSIVTQQSLLTDSRYREVDANAFTIVVLLDCDRTEDYATRNGNIFEVLNYFQAKTTIGVGYYENKSSFYFGTPTFHFSIEQAIKSKIFRPIMLTKVRRDVPSSHDSSVRAGVLGISDNAELYKAAKYITDLTKEDEKTIILCPSIQAAKLIANAINIQKNSSIYCQVVSSGYSTKQQNQKAIRQYMQGICRMLAGANYLLEGTDLHTADNIVVLRPFKSMSILLRFISRFLSVGGNKLNPVHILDFIGIPDANLPTTIRQKQASISTDEEELENPKKQPVVSKSKLEFSTKNNIEGVIGVNEIAEELADIIINMPCEAGCMVGIFGKWGRGKTFLMNQTWNVIRNQSPADNRTEEQQGGPPEHRNFKRIDFHAWKYQDTPAVWAYLYEKFAEAYYACGREGETQPGWFSRAIRHPWNRFWRIFNLNTTRLGWRNILLFFTLLFGSILWAFALTLPEKLNICWKIVTSLGISTVVSGAIIFFRYRNPAIQLFRKYYSKPSFISVLGIQEEVQKELRCLIEAWIRKEKNVKFLLFVDDIDRCTEDKIIQLIDALRVMLDDELLSRNIVVTAAIDERILKRAIQRKYNKLICCDPNEEDALKKEFVKEYLDKIFLMGLKLGALTPDEMDEFFLALTKDDRGPAENISSAEQSDFEADPPADGLSESADKNKTEPESASVAGPDDIHRPDSQPNFRPEPMQENSSAAKLSDDELRLFREILHSYENRTPRQIKILYYRYLFAKNLLIRQYKDIPEENIWIHAEYVPHVIRLIFEINQCPEDNILSRERMNSNKWTNAEQRTYLKELSISLNDYKRLIYVLDIVCGY